VGDRRKNRKTRISAIADFAGKGKRKKKALRSFLRAGRRYDHPGAFGEKLRVVDLSGPNTAGGG